MLSEGCLCMYECLYTQENAPLCVLQVISYVCSLNLRHGEKYVGPLSDSVPWCSERYCLPYCCWKAPSVPGTLIYVPEPLHLQLLSIRLYNIRPIVQLPALSALPRPVSKTSPTHNHTTGAARRGGGGLIGWSERSKRWGKTDRRKRRRRGRECRDGEGDRGVASRDGRGGKKDRGADVRGEKRRWGWGQHVEGSVEMGDVHLSPGFIVP